MKQKISCFTFLVNSFLSISFSTLRAAELRREVLETMETQVNSWPGTIRWCLSPVLILYSWFSGQGFLTCLTSPHRGAVGHVSGDLWLPESDHQSSMVRYKRTGWISQSLPADTQPALSQEGPRERDCFHPR